MCSLIKPINIGKATLKNNLILAPMAGYTDLPFRRIAFECGAGLAPTEMVSVRGLLHGNIKTKDLMTLHEIEKPSCVQLFGNEPDDFYKIAQEGLLKDFDIVDINMGCPMPKITKNGDGSALLSDKTKASAVISALVKSGITATAKVRLGINDNIGAVDFCMELEQAGVSAITVHGRTAKQLYAGIADWEEIGKIADAIKIPVFGNGDVDEKNALERLKAYPIVGLMIGRNALSNPSIFDKITNPTTQSMQIKEIVLRHIQYNKAYYSNKQFIVHKLRKHFAYYLKLFSCNKQIKAHLLTATDLNEIECAIENMV